MGGRPGGAGQHPPRAELPPHGAARGRRAAPAGVSSARSPTARAAPVVSEPPAAGTKTSAGRRGRRPQGSTAASLRGAISRGEHREGFADCTRSGRGGRWEGPADWTERGQGDHWEGFADGTREVGGAVIDSPPSTARGREAAGRFSGEPCLLARGQKWPK